MDLIHIHTKLSELFTQTLNQKGKDLDAAISFAEYHGQGIHNKAQQECYQRPVTRFDVESSRDK